MNIGDIKKVTVIGAGAMGHGIAQICATAGFKTTIKEVKQDYIDSGIFKIKESLDYLVDNDKLTSDERQDILSNRIQGTLDMKNAVSDAQLIIEAVPETLDLKKSLFKEVSGFAPTDAVFATNTSTMRIRDIAEAVSHPKRFAGLHFFNPVPKMKLVEIIKGRQTDPECIALLNEFVMKINKVPVAVLKDTPGFIVNRINAPNQALMNAILDEGKIQPDRIDTTLKRIGVSMGPFELADFVGLDVFCHTLDYYAETLSPEYAPGKVVSALVAGGKLGMKSGRGIYNWDGETAKIDMANPCEEITPMEFLAIQLNEAVKVYKEGICESAKQIDKAVVHGMRAFAGPFALCAGMQPEQISQPLQKLQKRFHLGILAPEPEIVDGSFKQFS
ncbi:MAG: 3-hydroxyacyl-CoA dehydrogenase family protein [Desulfobacteraceae bacterium]|jgi:enoyl-CoA hydratase/3-hydroxyacyl-CoA dehydrogenase